MNAILRHNYIGFARRKINPYIYKIDLVIMQPDFIGRFSISAFWNPIRLSLNDHKYRQLNGSLCSSSKLEFLDFH